MCTAFAAILRDAASDLERFAGIVRVEIYAGAGALAESGGQVRPDFARRCNVLSLLLGISKPRGPDTPEAKPSISREKTRSGRSRGIHRPH